MKVFGPKRLILLATFACTESRNSDRQPRVGRPVPVEVAEVESGTIALHRRFSGSLEAWASIDVSAKVAGRVEQLHVDLADPVRRGQLVAELEKGDLVQAVRTAEAELAVSRASLASEQAQQTATQKNLDRLKRLAESRMVAASQVDEALAADLAARAAIDQAKATIESAKARLDGARIRLGYTRVLADWTGGDDSRVISERFVDAGDVVLLNAPLFSIVETDPLVAVFFVTERDYAALKTGQAVTLTTDAYPTATFAGHVDRIAPVFEPGSRQARVEVRVENADGRLRPGMFVRAEVQLNVASDAQIVPEVALVRRDDATGVFQIAPDGRTVVWKTVSVGIRDGDRVQVIGDVEGQVVTLGHQLIDDGSEVRVSNDPVKPFSMNPIR